MAGRLTIKILLIDDGLEWRGGQRQVLLLARGLAARGIGVALACRPGGELAKRAGAEGIALREISMRGEWDIFAARRLGAMAREYDVLHTQTSHTHTLALFAVRIGTKKPVAAHRRVDFAPGKGPFNRWKYNAPDRIIAISDAVAGILKSSGVIASKIRVVYSGVDSREVESAKPVDLRRELGLPPNSIIVGNIAQLVDHKGHRYLIDAAPELLKAFPNAHIVIAGSGPLQESLQAQIKDHGLSDRAHLLGYRNDANGLLKSFDLFAMPSHLEGMGTVVLDAFIAGAPVVAAAAGGIAEMVKNGETGRLVPVKDSKSLATAMIESLKNTAESRRMAENAKRLFLEKFTADRMVDGVIEVYRELKGLAR